MRSNQQYFCEHLFTSRLPAILTYIPPAPQINLQDPQDRNEKPSVVVNLFTKRLVVFYFSWLATLQINFEPLIHAKKDSFKILLSEYL